MGHEQELEAQWQIFAAEVKSRLNFGPLISALNRRDAEAVRLCLRLCQDNTGLAEKIPQNGRLPVLPPGSPGTENYFG